MDGLSTMSTFDLVSELRNRSDVVAVQVWTKDDIVNAIKEQCGIGEPSDGLIYTVAIRVQDSLEDCGNGWETIYAAIDGCCADE